MGTDVHPASYPMGTGAGDHSSPPIAWFRNTWSYSSTPFYLVQLRHRQEEAKNYIFRFDTYHEKCL
jgi:hypothetical protein